MPTQRPLGTAGRSADRRERSAPILGRVRIGDALRLSSLWVQGSSFSACFLKCSRARRSSASRSEEHTSELQSHSDLVCRLLLEVSGDHRDLHSFPTRRSSDLDANAAALRDGGPVGRQTRTLGTDPWQSQNRGCSTALLAVGSGLIVLSLLFEMLAGPPIVGL